MWRKLLLHAIQIYRRAEHLLKSERKEKDEEDGDCIAFSLAHLIVRVGKLDESEIMFMRASQGKKKALECEHTSTLHTVHNFSNLCRAHGKLGEAEKMYLRALQGEESTRRRSAWSTTSTISTAIRASSKRKICRRV